MSLRVENLESAVAVREHDDPASLCSELYPYQRQALAWMMEREKECLPRGGVLADEIGLGKTVEIISLILANRRPQQVRAPDAHSRATLIVSPQTIANQWVSEMQKHARDMRITSFPGSERCQMRLSELAAHDVILVTYEVLTKEVWRARFPNPRYPSLLTNLELWRVVLDEVQYAKGGRQAGKMVRMLKAVNRWAVSGTPMRPGFTGDLTQLLSFVCGTEWLEEQGWKSLVREIDRDPGRRQELVAKFKPLFLRRTKDAVHSQLGLPVQHSQSLYVSATLAELVLRESFVMRSALMLETASMGRGDDQGDATAVLGDDLLSTHLQLSSLSPSLWAQWGSKGSAGGAGKLVGELQNFTLDPTDLWDDMKLGVHDALKESRAKLVEVVREGLKGLLPDEDDLGIEEEGSKENKMLQKKQKQRRIAGGKELVNDLEFLQLLVATSTLARLAPSLTSRLAMRVLFDNITKPPVEPISSKAAAKSAWLTLRYTCVSWFNHSTTSAERMRWLRALAPPGARLAANQNAHDPAHGSWSVLVPARWAELEPFLCLHFRPFNAREIASVDAHGDSDGYVISMKARRRVQHPANLIWVGRPFVNLLSDENAKIHARRLLCRKGATTLPFALALELGDVFRHRTFQRKQVVKECGGLAKGIERFPYVEDVAAETTLDALLAVPPRADTMVSGWALKKDKSMLGPLDTKLLAPLRRQKNKLNIEKLNICRSQAAISTILHNAGFTVNGFVRKLRQESDKHSARNAASLPKAQTNAAALRMRFLRSFDDLFSRCHSFENSGEKAQAVAGQRGLVQSSKVHALLQLLSNQLAGQKVVVFTAFAQAVSILKAAVQSKLGPAGAVELCAVTLKTAAERRSAVDTFNTIPDCKVIVLQAGATHSGAGAAGLTLTAARHVVLMDVVLDPMVELQAIGRVHRIGQQYETNVWHVLTRGSVDVALRHLGDSRGELRLRSLLPSVAGLKADAEIAAAEIHMRPAAAQADVEHEQEELEQQGGVEEEQWDRAAGSLSADDGVDEMDVTDSAAAPAPAMDEALAMEDATSPAPGSAHVLVPKLASLAASSTTSRTEDARTVRKRKLRELKEDLEDGDINKATYDRMIELVYRGEL